MFAGPSRLPRGFLLVWTLFLGSAIHAQEPLSIPTLEFARSRIGNELEIRGVLQNRTESMIRILRMSLAFLHDSGATIHTENLSQIDSLPPRRAARIAHKARQIEAFVRYRVHILLESEGREQSVDFEGTPEGGHPLPIPSKAANLSSKTSLPTSSSTIQSRIEPTARGVEIHVKALQAAPILVAEVIHPGAVPSPVKWLLLDQELLPAGFKGHYILDMPNHEERGLPSIRVFSGQLHPLQHPHFPSGSLTLGRSRFVLLGPHGTVGFLSVRSLRTTTIGDTRIIIHCRDEEGDIIESQTVQLPGNIAPKGIVPFTVHFQAVRSFHSFDYQIDYDSPQQDSPPQSLAPPDVHRLEREISPKSPDPLTGTRIGLDGVHYVYRRVRKGRNWVYRGGMYFLKLRIIDGSKTFPRPTGTIRIVARMGSKIVSRIRRTLTQKNYQRSLDQIEPSSLHRRQIFYESSSGTLYVAFLELRETQPLDFQLEVQLQTSDISSRWTWKNLQDPHIELPRIPGESN